jgi:uncharacterized Fe-S cluster-containing radical SAM superfamily protein
MENSLDRQKKEGIIIGDSMSKDFDKVKVCIHNYGPYLGEKIIIDAGKENGMSLDFQSLSQLIKDLQEIEKNILYYLSRDDIKENMLNQLWEDIELNPSIKDERMERFQSEVMKFYETGKT